MNFKVYFTFKPCILDEDKFDDWIDLAKLFIQILKPNEDISFLDWDFEPEILSMFLETCLD